MTETNPSTSPDKGRRKTIKNLIKYTPAIDQFEGKYSIINLLEYGNTRGLVTRTVRNTKPVGYCTTNPLILLKNLFDNTNIAKINGYSFYDSSNFQSPKYGLEIIGIDALFGINGNIADLKEQSLVQLAKRNKTLSKPEILGIVSTLKKIESIHAILPDYKQKQKDIEQILESIEFSS